jgi:hypothetical protein
MPTTEAEAIELLKRLVIVGCPTYRCNDASRTRNDCLMCQLCDANLELNEEHHPECLWLRIVRLVEANDGA